MVNKNGCRRNSADSSDTKEKQVTIYPQIAQDVDTAHTFDAWTIPNRQGGHEKNR